MQYYSYSLFLIPSQIVSTPLVLIVYSYYNTFYSSSEGGQPDDEVEAEVGKCVWDVRPEGLGSWLLIRLFCVCEYARPQLARYLRM